MVTPPTFGHFGMHLNTTPTFEHFRMDFCFTQKIRAGPGPAQGRPRWVWAGPYPSGPALGRPGAGPDFLSEAKIHHKVLKSGCHAQVHPKMSKSRRSNHIKGLASPTPRV